ncbi:hypothetical protein [Qipengyuania sp.]|uniref:hypothetical protein n=1 Tax=Qipengyuania sp. TaxID=2004515 RepID=UPI0035C87D74
MRAAGTPQRSGTQAAFGTIAAGLLGNKLSRKTRIALERGDNPRSGQPVWRNSYYEGQVEDRVWRRYGDGSKRQGKRATGAIRKAARRFELETRAKRKQTEPGVQNGALGAIGLEVLDTLCELVDFMTGRLEPAIATIAERIGRSYSAVHLALRRLQRAGFIDWMRRSKPVDNPVPGGPMVEQISNAYAILVPDGLRFWWDRTFGRAPVPACAQDAAARDKADFDRMIAGLSAKRYVADFVRDPLLGPILDRLAARIDAREGKDRESGTCGETGGVLQTP